MLRRASVLLRFLAALYAATVLLAAGASGAGSEAPVAARGNSAAPAAPGSAPAAAWVRGNRLMLAYGTAPALTWLVAEWPAAPASGRHRYESALLEVLDSPPPAPAELAAEWQAVTLHGLAAWRATIAPLLLKYAPVEAQAATLVSAQGEDFVLYRDAAGLPQAATAAARPAGLRIAGMVGEDAFAAAAGAHLRETLSPAGGTPGPALFVTAEDSFGAALVLFDFAGNRSVFIAQPASTLPFDRRLGLSLRLFEALTVQSHALALLRNPVTSVNRLAWLTYQSGAAVVPRRLPKPAGDPLPGPTAGAPMDPRAWEAQLDGLVTPARERGRMWPLIDGNAYFAALLEAIGDARESIDIQVYIFDGDDYALKVADLLKQRSREVRVRVLVDRLGSMMAGQVPSRSPYFSRGQPPLSIVDYLRRDSAIEVRALDNPWLTSDHTKLIVVDGRRAFTGGMNIGREYRYEWHDLMVGLEGPVVGRLQQDFDRHWAYAGPGGDLAWALAGARPAPAANDPDGDGHFDIRPLYTRAADPQILRAQLAAMRAAQSRIWVQQPYVSDDEVIDSLIDARRRGVDVRVVLPTRNDSGFMHSANLLAAKAFVANGIRVYAYPGMTHVKAALYDGWACIGSANFDKLSLRVNREIDLATSDPGFVAALERDLFLADFARSQEWVRPQPVRWTDYIAEFFADQL